LAAFGFPHAWDDLGLVVQSRIGHDVVDGARGTGLGVDRSEHQPRDSGMNDRARAHDTRFERAIERHPGEAVVAGVVRGVAQRHDFGMARRVLRRDGPVETAPDNGSFLCDNHGANRNLSCRQRRSRLLQSLLHEFIIHARMLNYPTMKSLRGLAFALLLSPLPGMAQGVRMPADFLPLDVGKRWTYDLTDAAGQKIGQIAFAVEEYTIISGTSFYILSEFPFSMETGEPLRMIRYDKDERYFLRKLRNDEGPLFLDDGAITEVLESDSSGSPQKFILRRDKMTLTFQRGVGIVEAKFERSGAPVIATLVAALPDPPAGRGAGRPPVAISPVTKDPVIIPPPVTQPNRREAIVATVTSQNPRIDVAVSPSAGAYRIAMIVTNVSDKLLPFRFGSGQTYDFVIHDVASGKEVWRWSNGNFFTQVVRSDSIRPGGKWQFEVTWNRKDNDDKPVPAGQYRVIATITSLPAVQASPVLVEVQ